MSETSLDRVVLEYQRPELFIAADEEHPPGFRSTTPSSAIWRSMCGSDSFTNVLSVKARGELGQHRHRRRVSGYVLEGSCATSVRLVVRPRLRAREP